MRAGTALLPIRRAGVQPGAGARGIVALEAALVLPVLVLLTIAALETYSYLRAATIISRSAFEVAQVVAHQAGWTDQGNCNAANDICTLTGIGQELSSPLNFSQGGALAISVYAADPGPPSAPWEKGDPSSWLLPAAWQIQWSGSDPAPLPAANHWPPATVGYALVRVDVGFRYAPVLLSSQLWSSIVGSQNLHRHAQVLAPHYLSELEN